MRIKILNQEICQACTQRTCSMNDVIAKSDFYNLKSEQYTCPVKMFAYGLTDDQLERGYIDYDLDNNSCLYCCLCAIQCSQNNLQILNYDYDARTDFQKLKDSGDFQSQGPSNAIAMSYLHRLYGFAANTNFVRTLSFDGVVINEHGEACFVEVDINNDSLECCRRLLADIVVHNHRQSRRIDTGLIVLNDFPRPGSRDVFSVIEKLNSYPRTAHLVFYFTTFSFLRYLVLNRNGEHLTKYNVFYNPLNETQEQYLDRLIQDGIITEELRDDVF